MNSIVLESYAPMVIYIPAFVCLIGLLVYAFINGKPGELGRLAFFAGLFVTLWVFAMGRVHLP